LPRDSAVQAVAKPLILAAAASGVERAAAAAGINSHRVLELAGVDPARIGDPTLRLERSGKSGSVREHQPEDESR
jgi:hypothetical protein